ncbi:capsule assembly Wzi family protein [Marinobacter caseinilyticus]|uniref:capsule assembly Wzi family protein n=1 Tax=Marinobacter caseinilyticus TaxID=2692195 RepID=UPI00140812E0|nr:capsule assembly Wzi family protein [Marinobacter caseinilyticus]
MTSKHWTLVGGAVACLITLFPFITVQAAPWLSPGDLRARHAVQKLADRGHLNRAVTTWPMMWGSVDSGLDRRGAASDVSSVAPALAYLRFEREAQASPGIRAEFRLAGTTDPVFLRGFAASPREQGMVSGSLEWQGDAWAASVQPTYSVNPEDDEDIRLDGSYLAGTAANWVFAVGAIDRWWGPGWQSSLILSNNARPVPAVWLNRKHAGAPETSWLQWLGPWQLTVYGGKLERERAVADAKLIGIRLTFRPIEGLDIGLSRSLMIGGKGRPENVSTLWNALIGRDNGQAGQQDDPGNQLGSIDVRYGFPIGEQSMSLYGQMMGEDEAGAFPARKSWLFGADMTSQLFSSDQQWFVEYTNTLADDFLGDAMPNITYDHSIYRSGYRHYGRNMAASIDGDAEAFTVGAYNFFGDGRNLGASLSYANLNIDGGTRVVVTDDNLFYAVLKSNQKVAIANIRYGQPLFAGWLDLSAQLADKKLELIGGEKDQWSMGAQWRYRF